MEIPVHSRVKSIFATAAALALLAAPGIAEACSVCSAGRDDESRTAFILTTAFLTLLPLALVGGMAWWLRRRTRQVSSWATQQPPARPAPIPRIAKA